jgi:hypothetical protein
MNNDAESVTLQGYEFGRLWAVHERTDQLALGPLIERDAPALCRRNRARPTIAVWTIPTTRF